MKSKAVCLIITILCTSASLCAQGNNSGNPSGPAASQGSATIENQMIAYEVLRQTADQISERVAQTCKCNIVLFNDANAQSEITAAKAFHVSAQALIDAYKALIPKAEALAVPSLSDVAALLGAIKSSATYSNQNFQPTPQSMITLLSIALNKKSITLRTSTLPGDLGKGAEAVQSELNDITAAQKEVKDPKARADLDKEFSALRTSLTATSPDGTVLATIIKGKALLASLGSQYPVLTLSIDAAGGDTKVTHFFWRELFWPTPSPSYNGGSEVTFLLTDQNGNFQDGYQFHYMYDFSKLKSPKVPKTFDVTPPQH